MIRLDVLWEVSMEKMRQQGNQFPRPWWFIGITQDLGGLVVHATSWLSKHICEYLLLLKLWFKQMMTMLLEHMNASRCKTTCPQTTGFSKVIGVTYGSILLVNDRFGGRIGNTKPSRTICSTVLSRTAQNQKVSKMGPPENNWEWRSPSFCGVFNGGKPNS